MTTMIADELGRIPMSPFLTATLTRAADYASAQLHRQVTLEHLLLALAEDPEATVVLKSSNIDLARLTAEVSDFLGRSEDRNPSGGGSVALSQDLRRVLEAAAAAAQQGRRREINGAIVLAAIVGDGKSTAAHLLRNQGLTFEAAIRALQRISPAPGAPAASEPGPNATTDELMAAARERVQTRAAPNLEMPAPPAGPGSAGAVRAEPSNRASNDVLEREYKPVNSVDPASAAGSRVDERPEDYRVEPQFTPEPVSPPLASLPRQDRPQAPVGREPPPWTPAPSPAPQQAPPQMRPPPPRPPVPHASMGAPGRFGAPMPPAMPPGGFSQPPPGQPRTQPPASAPWPEPADVRRGPPPPQSAPGQDRRRAGSGTFVGSWPLIEAGQLVENVPRRMRVGVPVVVEARIARADIKALADNLQGGATAFRHEVIITKAMSVRLRAPDGGFWIEARSPETQWIENVLGLSSDEFASWRWTITARERGKRQLQLIVSARTVGADGLTAETALPDQVIQVRVGINYGNTIRRWVGWTVAAIVGGLFARFGDGLFALIGLLIARLFRH